MLLPKKPITVLIAENEQITNNDAVKTFVGNNPFISLIEIENSKHEMLIEKDTIRKKVLQEIVYAFGK